MLKPMKTIRKTQAITLTRQPLTAANVFAAWRQQLDRAPHILVALSGGLDSTLLLHLVAEAVPFEKIRAIHINPQRSRYKMPHQVNDKTPQPVPAKHPHGVIDHD